MEPTKAGEIGVVVVAVVGTCGDVVGLEPIGRVAAVGGAHPSVPPRHVATCCRWDRGRGVPDPKWFAVCGEGDQIDRRLAQQAAQRRRSDPGPDGIQPEVSLFDPWRSQTTNRASARRVARDSRCPAGGSGSSSATWSRASATILPSSAGSLPHRAHDVSSRLGWIARNRSSNAARSSPVEIGVDEPAGFAVPGGPAHDADRSHRRRPVRQPDRTTLRR